MNASILGKKIVIERSSENLVVVYRPFTFGVSLFISVFLIFIGCRIYGESLNETVLYAFIFASFLVITRSFLANKFTFSPKEITIEKSLNVKKEILLSEIKQIVVGHLRLRRIFTNPFWQLLTQKELYLVDYQNNIYSLVIGSDKELNDVKQKITNYCNLYAKTDITNEWSKNEVPFGVLYEETPDYISIKFRKADRGVNLITLLIVLPLMLYTLEYHQQFYFYLLLFPLYLSLSGLVNYQILTLNRTTFSKKYSILPFFFTFDIKTVKISGIFLEKSNISYKKKYSTEPDSFLTFQVYMLVGKMKKVFMNHNESVSTFVSKKLQFHLNKFQNQNVQTQILKDLPILEAVKPYKNVEPVVKVKENKPISDNKGKSPDIEV